MIKLSYFYLFSNFLSIAQEFGEDHARVKMKSLVSEREYEFKYEDIVKISFENHANSRQMSFGFGLLAILMLILAFSPNAIISESLPLMIIRFLFVLSTILFLSGFIKNRYYYLLDANNHVLALIRVTSSNYDLIVKVVELVRTKSGVLKENTFDEPFPSSRPVFELVSYDIPNYLNKSITRFYEDEFIEFNSSIYGENVSNYRYDQLSGNVYRGKQGNDAWDSIFWLVLVISGIIIGSFSAFNIPSRAALLITAAVLAILLVVSFLLRYAKQEILGLYDKGNQIVFWTWINRANREKVESIIKYVQTRISP